MDDVIQCPTCSKKYRLKGAPPPTFQCRSCGTVMDLSAFAAPEVPPPAQPVAPVPPPPAGRGAAPGRSAAPHRSGRPGGSRVRSRGGGRHGRGRGPDAEDDYDDEGYHPHYHSSGPNPALVYGSAIVVVAALIGFVIWMARPSPKPTEEPKKEEAVVPLPTTPIPDEEEPEAPPKKAPRVDKSREDEKRPELREGSLDSIPIPEGKSKYRYQQAEIKTYPWPDYVTQEQKDKVEKAVADLNSGSYDAKEAEDYLVALDARAEDGSLKPGDKFIAVGRLISEFKNILDEYGGQVNDRMCLSRLMVIDRILRGIDGMQQRDFGDREGIRSQSTDTQVMKVIKRWNWWYDLEKWRIRREPWDESLDLEDPEAMGDDELPDD